MRSALGSLRSIFIVLTSFLTIINCVKNFDRDIIIKDRLYVCVSGYTLSKQQLQLEDELLLEKGGMWHSQRPSVHTFSNIQLIFVIE